MDDVPLFAVVSSEALVAVAYSEVTPAAVETLVGTILNLAVVSCPPYVTHTGAIVALPMVAAKPPTKHPP